MFKKNYKNRKPKLNCLQLKGVSTKTYLSI